MQVRKQQLELGMEQQNASKLGQEFVKAAYCHSACLTYTQSILWEMLTYWMDEAQARIKTARRDIKNLRYIDDTTLMAESEEELKSLLMKVKEESGKSWHKAQHSENSARGIRSHHFMANWWGNNGNSERLNYFGLQNHCRWWLQPWNKRHLLLGRKTLTNLDSILKIRDITLPTKFCLVKAMVFLVVMYGCESWIIKKAECWRTDVF